VTARLGIAFLVLAPALGSSSGCRACEDRPPPPPVVDSMLPMSTAPVAVPSTALCFGAICKKGQLCYDASHALDAGAPYGCFDVPSECAKTVDCDCLLEHGNFDCPAPNKLLCNDIAGGTPQVVCVRMYE
jgi:hypothetical protein